MNERELFLKWLESYDPVGCSMAGEDYQEEDLEAAFKAGLKQRKD